MNVDITYQQAVSIANFLDKSASQNEDYISKIPNEDDNFLMWAVADGAGGAGVFSREWANYLGSKVPVRPSKFKENKSKKWFEKISREFYETVINKQDLSDLILQKKVFIEGSFATLSVCWLNKHSNKIYFTSTGDSCVFYFEKDNTEFLLKFMTSLNRQSEIDDYPALLNWNIKNRTELPFNSCTINNEFKVIIATDSLAKWILLYISLFNPLALSKMAEASFMKSVNSEKYEQRKTNMMLGSKLLGLEELFDLLKHISSGEDIFRKTMQNLFNQGEIDIDDYSLIFIEGNVSNKESI